MGFDGADLARLVARFRESGSAVEDIDAPGGPIRLRKRPEPGVAFRVESLASGAPEIALTAFEPADRPGPGYPVGMPFIPNLQVSVTTGPTPDRPTLAWWGVPDASGVATELVRQLERDGWEPAGEEALPPPISVRHITLRRGFEERIILATDAIAGGMVQLMVPQSGGVT